MPRATSAAEAEHPPPAAASISGIEKRFAKVIRSESSPVSPEFDSISNASARVTAPRSPWLASAGCTKCAGVPVDASVAAILRAMWPDFPIPLTITRPLTAMIVSTAREKSPFSVSPSDSIAADAYSSTRRAAARSPMWPLENLRTPTADAEMGSAGRINNTFVRPAPAPPQAPYLFRGRHSNATQTRNSCQKSVSRLWACGGPGSSTAVDER